eukprot:gene8931-6267_t
MYPSLRALLVSGTSHSIVTCGLSAYWDSAGNKAHHIFEKLWGRASVAILGAGVTTSHAAAILASWHYPLQVLGQHLRLTLQRRIWDAGADFHSTQRWIRDALHPPPPGPPFQQSFFPALSHAPYHSLMLAYEKSRFHTTLAIDGRPIHRCAVDPERASAAQRHTLQYCTVGHVVPADDVPATRPAPLAGPVGVCLDVRRSTVPVPGVTIKEAASHVFRCPAKPGLEVSPFVFGHKVSYQEMLLVQTRIQHVSFRIGSRN